MKSPWSQLFVKVLDGELKATGNRPVLPADSAEQQQTARGRKVLFIAAICKDVRQSLWQESLFCAL